MGKTNELRALILSMLETTGIASYYEVADKDAPDNRIVFSFDDTTWSEEHRDDVTVFVDIWDRKTDGSEIERIEDEKDLIEKLFSNQNLPQDKILPTFYVERTRNIEDPDKNLLHRQIEILVQNYERK